MQRTRKRTSAFMAVLFMVSLLLTAASFAAQHDGRAAKGLQEAGPQVHKASTVIGSRVENPQGESLGTIDDVVLDPVDGRIRYAALSYGGLFGFGSKLFAVSWEALTLLPDGETFSLSIARETLENAVGFAKENWPQQPDPLLMDQR